jgi:hypothetical protein
MSSTGRCFDNARMESFFATLKKERINKIRTETMSMEKVKSIVFRFIEIYYIADEFTHQTMDICP